MTDYIPFFSDLPIKAIPAVQRLYDDVHQPGFSLPKVYSDLISRLNAVSVSAPPRKVVSQWLAAVRIGMATRPETPGSEGAPVSALAPDPDYFEALPAAAMPWLTDAWDAISASALLASREELDEADERAFEVFFDAMLAIGHKEPSWRGFAAYAKAIRLGQVERPARQTDADIAPGAEPAPELSSAEATPMKRRGRLPKVAITQPAHTEASGDNAAPAFVPLTPQSFAEALADDATAEAPSLLQSLRDRMVADAYARLQADLQRQAEAMVIAQLRAAADELESKIAC